MAAATTTIIRNSTLNAGNGVVTASAGDSVSISGSEITGADGTIVISGSGANFDIRHSLIENPDSFSLIVAFSGGSATITNSRFIVDSLSSNTINSSTEVCLGNSLIVTSASPSTSFLTDTCN